MGEEVKTLFSGELEKWVFKARGKEDDQDDGARIF